VFARPRSNAAKSGAGLEEGAGCHGVTYSRIPLPFEAVDCGGNGCERFWWAIQAAVLNVTQDVYFEFREVLEHGARNLLPRFHAGYIHSLTFQKGADMGDIGHEFFGFVAFGHVNQDGALFLVVQVEGLGNGDCIAPGSRFWCWLFFA